MANPFTLKIFVANGDPDWLLLVERSNWTGKAVMFPRAVFTDVRSRDEFNQTGVYLLLGPRPKGEGEMIYIGQGDPVRPRLESHHANKDFWTRAVFFVAPDHLNTAGIKFLEARLVNLAKAAKRMTLDNANSPTEPTLSEADCAEMKVFLQNILDILPVLGIHAFEQSTVPGGTGAVVTLHCSGRGVKATGYDTPGGFIVQSGSLAVVDEVPSFKERFASTCELRADLVENEVLLPEGNTLRFTQDYTFNSPSLASAVVLGRSSNGRTSWKDASGRTLKKIQESQSENTADSNEDQL